MYEPPLGPEERSPPREPTWRRLAVGYAMVAAVPLLLWVASRPLTGGAALVAAVGLFVAARRAARLARCLSDCGGFALDVGRTVRICVSRPRIDSAN